MLSILLRHPNLSPTKCEDAHFVELPTDISARICEKYGNETLFAAKNKKRRITFNSVSDRSQHISPREHITLKYPDVSPALKDLLKRRVKCHKTMETIVFDNVSRTPPFYILGHSNLTFEDVRVAALMDVAIRHDPDIIRRGFKKWFVHVLAFSDNVHSWWHSLNILKQVVQE